LDTNGFYPEILEECLPYVDYVALDIKTSLQKYVLLGAENTDGFQCAVKLLKTGRVAYEFRTTVVPEFVTEEDVVCIGEIAKGAKILAFQQFVPQDTLDKRFGNMQPYAPETIKEFAETMKKYVENTVLRV